MNRPYRHAGGKYEIWLPAERTWGLQTFLAEAVKLPFLGIGKDIVCDRFVVLRISDDMVVKVPLPDTLVAESGADLLGGVHFDVPYGFR